jgi:hypothetical protein
MAFPSAWARRKTRKIRRSVSGMACSLSAVRQRICLLVFDEGVEARYATLRDATLAVGPERVVLRADEGELDAEGAATDGSYFYVTGSHSAKRSDCQSNPHSRHVIRFRRDPATGRALRSPAVTPAESWWTTRTAGACGRSCKRSPNSRRHVGEGKCLGSAPPPEAPQLAGNMASTSKAWRSATGACISASVARPGRARRVILAVDSRSAVQGRRCQGQRHPNQGRRRAWHTRHGCRSRRFLAACRPGRRPRQSGARELVDCLVGRKKRPGRGDAKNASHPGFGRRGSCARLKTGKANACEDKALKPEAMTVLEETPQDYKLLILSDGMCDGGALAFTVPR